NPANSGSGFGYNCAGDLLVTDEIHSVVYAVDSTLSGWCAHKKIPWLTVAPTQGTLAPGAAARVALGFDGTDQKEFTTSQGFLRVTGSPRPMLVPITVHWEPRPVDLDVIGSVSPTGAVNNGDALAYSITVQNLASADGTANHVQLTYELPEGVNYLASNGAHCEVPPAASSAGVITASVAGPATVVCNLGSIAPDTGKLVNISVQATTDADTVTGTFT